MTDETKKIRPTFEQRLEKAKAKVEALEMTAQNRFSKVVWCSALSHRKGELNKDKTKTYTEKLIIFRDFINQSLEASGYKEDAEEIEVEETLN